MKYIILIISTFFANTNWANPYIDSLENIWNDESKSDSIRGYAYYNMYRKIYYKIDDSTGRNIARKLYIFANKRGLNHLKGKALLNLGLKQNFGDSTLYYQKKALDVFSSINDKKGQAGALFNIAIVYRNKQLYNNAFTNCKKAIDLCIEVDDKEYLVSGFNTLATICARVGETTLALQYAKRSIELAKELKIIYYAPVAGLSTIGTIHKQNNNYEESIRAFSKMFYLCKKLNIKESKANASAYLAFNFATIGQMDSAIYYNEYAKNLTESGSPLFTPIHLNDALIYNYTKSYKNAIDAVKEAKKLQEHFEKYDVQMELTKNLYIAYKGLNDLKKALIYHEKISDWQDSIKTQIDNYQLQRLEIRSSLILDSLEQEKVLQEEIRMVEEAKAAKIRKNRIQYSLVIILVLLLATAIAVFTKFKISHRLASGLIFIFFILTFEFLLVVLDPWVDTVSNGEVGWKIAINTAIALVLFGIHQLSEKKLKNAIFKADR